MRPSLRTPSYAVTSALALALAACGAQTAANPVAPPSPLVIPADGVATTRQDPAEILRAEVQGDLLLLDVRHGGGCAEHRYALLHSQVFMESLPVQTEVTLAHDANGDPCRALVHAQLRLDLTPVRHAFQRAYAEHGVLVLHLRAPGTPGPATHTLRYQF